MAKSVYRLHKILGMVRFCWSLRLQWTHKTTFAAVKTVPEHCKCSERRTEMPPLSGYARHADPTHTSKYVLLWTSRKRSTVCVTDSRTERFICITTSVNKAAAFYYAPTRRGWTLKQVGRHHDRRRRDRIRRSKHNSRAFFLCTLCPQKTSRHYHL